MHFFDLADIVDDIYILALCFVRIIFVFLFIPPLDSKMLGGAMVRNAIVITFCLFTFPVIENQLSDITLNKISFSVIILQEMIIGSMYGFFISLPFTMVNIFGSIIDVQRGSQNAQIHNVSSGGSSTEMTVFFGVCFSYIFFVLGPFTIAMKIILFSYHHIPINSFLINLNEYVLISIAQGFQSAMMSALTFVIPIIMVIFFVDLGLGLTNRFIPQLQVFILSMPIKSITGVFMSLVLLKSTTCNIISYTFEKLYFVEELHRFLL